MVNYRILSFILKIRAIEETLPRLYGGMPINPANPGSKPQC